MKAKSMMGCGVDPSPLGVHTGDWQHITLTVNDAGFARREPPAPRMHGTSSA